MVNTFGKFVRHLRIEKDIVLKDMADVLGVSSSMLSAVENNKKPVPLEWEKTLNAAYHLNENDSQTLHDAIVETIKQVRIDVSNVNQFHADTALSFARNFDKLDEEKIKKIFEIIHDSEEKND